MFKRIYLIIGLSLVLILAAATVQVQESGQWAGAVDASTGQAAQTAVTLVPQNWRGQYYNNVTLNGQPVLVRDDLEIDFDWGLDSPAQSYIEANAFSVRWINTVDLQAGLYRFAMTVDDGGRLWVNDQLLIDAWEVQSTRRFAEELYLPAGPVSLRMEYFEDKGQALARLEWEKVTEAVEWQAEYFNNPDLSGDPTLVRPEPRLNFNWRQGSPAPEQVGVNQFSARWRRTVDLSPGTYCFVMTVDDGGRLFVNGNLLIDAWQVQAQEKFLEKVDLPGGITALKMEYFEATGEAVAQLGFIKVDPNAPATLRSAGYSPANASFNSRPAGQRNLERCTETPLPAPTPTPLPEPVDR